MGEFTSWKYWTLIFDYFFNIIINTSVQPLCLKNGTHIDLCSCLSREDSPRRHALRRWRQSEFDRAPFKNKSNFLRSRTRPVLRGMTRHYRAKLAQTVIPFYLKQHHVYQFSDTMIETKYRYWQKRRKIAVPVLFVVEVALYLYQYRL